MFFRRIPSFALAILSVVSLLAQPNPRANFTNTPARFRTDRILVKFRNDQTPEAMAGIHSRHQTKVLRRFKSLGNVDVVALPDGANVQDLIRKYEASGLVEFAEPDYLLRAASAPNDPRFVDGTLWNMRNTGQSGGVSGADISAVAAWDKLNSASNIVVAIIDSGVRYTHEDLAANMWINPGETGLDAQGRDKRTNGIDDDGDGIIDDVYGIDAIKNSGDPIDTDGHGTHVAGIIGAVGNNRAGVVGVAWKVQIMACKFLESSGSGSVSDAIQCIDYARTKGAKIINASWGDYQNSSVLQSAIRRAGDAGIIFVAAAGNESYDDDAHPFFPAGYGLDNIVSVAATTRTDSLASFSNFGAATVDLAAPGSPIYSTYNTSDSSYTYLSGTSMSAPHVTGALALLRALHPEETYRQLINRVLATADPLPSLTGKCITGGRLNLQRALTADFIADFVATPMVGTGPLTVQFKDTSVGIGLQYEWDFGDTSAKSNEPNPNHLFEREGNYPVTITVTDQNKKVSSKSRTISVVANYQMRTTTFAWIDPSGMKALNLTDNGVSAAQTLPFSFSFYGQSYEQIYVSANGIIGFSNQRLETTTISDLPSASLPNAAICPWWDDLNPTVAGAQVRIGTSGAAPNRRAVISWINVPHRQSSTSPFTFQAILSEGSNEILFQYLEVQASRSRGAGKTAAIGIENETGLVAKKYSYNGSTLLKNNLAILFTPLSNGGIAVNPAIGLSLSGPVGGPFSPANQTYTIRNTAQSSVNWSAKNSQNWLTLSTSGGALAPGQSVSITASLNAAAQTLKAGSYLDTIQFANLANGNGNTTRSVSLAVNGINGVLEVTPPSDLNSSGFVGGPFNPVTQIYTLINTGDATIDWSAENGPDWISLSPSRGTLSSGESVTVTASVNLAANALPDGTYSSQFIFSNLTNGKGTANRNATLTVISPTASLLINPQEALQFSGTLGGPFLPSGSEITLANPTDASLEWSVNSSHPWLTLSSGGGRLEAGQSIPISVAINASANSLTSGIHRNILTFTTTGGAAKASLETTLTISPKAALTAALFDPSNHVLRMRVDGEPGQTFSIETSIDLIQWIGISTGVISSDGFFESSDSDTQSSAQRFYRAVLK